MKYSLKAKLSLKIPASTEEKKRSRERSRRRRTKANKTHSGSDTPGRPDKPQTRAKRLSRTVKASREIAKSYYQRVQGPKMRHVKENLIQQVRQLQGTAWNEKSTWLAVLEMATAYLQLAKLSRK